MVNNTNNIKQNFFQNIKILFTLKLWVFLFLINFSHAQVTQEWIARYSGAHDDYSASVACDSYGNVFVTGSGTPLNGNGSDIITIKYNSSGVQQWLVRYSGPENLDYASDFKIDTSGNVYVTGSSIYNINGFYRAVTIKYNSAGVQQWVTSDSTNMGYTFGTTLLPDNSGNVYVGEKYGTLTSGSGALIKYNSSGVQQWKTEFGKYYALTMDNYHNIIASGTYDFNYFTAKYNSSGVQQWRVIAPGPGPGNDGPDAIITDDTGNIYLTGAIYNNSMGGIVTLKYNSSGVQQWLSTYTTNARWSNSIGMDSAGNIYSAGSLYISANISYYVLLKYNNSGVQQWVITYGGNNKNYLSSMVTDRSGNCYVTGSSTQPPSYRLDFVTIKYNSSGVEQWLMSYNGSADSNDYASKIYRDQQNNVYVTGSAVGIGTGYDFVTIKYSQPIGIIKTSKGIPKNFNLYQNYPNPFNPKTIINYELPPAKDGMSQITNYVKLSIFDILGKEVAVLVNEKQNPGRYEVEWNASNYSSGLYFYKLQAGDFSQTKKLILLK